MTSSPTAPPPRWCSESYSFRRAIRSSLLAFLTFGVGFVVRPLGGVLFGILGDRYGRKPVLVATLLMIGVGTTAIGLLPTYNQIGLWAPLLLGVMRVIQGLGAGA
jgi:MFS family permease